MSRFNSGGAYGFRCNRQEICGTHFWCMSWTVDRYYKGDRLRYPHNYSRDTEDERAARRFCKRHKLEFE